MKKALPFIFIAAAAGAAWYFLRSKQKPTTTGTPVTPGTQPKQYTAAEIEQIKKAVAGRG